MSYYFNEIINEIRSVIQEYANGMHFGNIIYIYIYSCGKMVILAT